MSSRNSDVPEATKYQYILPKPSPANKTRKTLADIKNVIPLYDQTGTFKPTPNSHSFEQHMENNSATTMLWKLSRQHQIDQGLRGFKSLDILNILKEEDKGFLLFVITHGNQLATKMPHLSEPEALNTFKMLWSKMTDEHKSWYHNNENVIQMASIHQHGLITEPPPFVGFGLESSSSSTAINQSQSNVVRPPIQSAGVAPQMSVNIQQNEILTNVRYAPNNNAPGKTSSNAPFADKFAVLPKVKYLCNSDAVSHKKDLAYVKHSSNSRLSKQAEFVSNGDKENKSVTFAPNLAILPNLNYRPYSFIVSRQTLSDEKGKQNKEMIHEVGDTCESGVPQALDLSKPDSYLVPKKRVSPSVSHLPNSKSLPSRVLYDYTASSQSEFLHERQNVQHSDDRLGYIPMTNYISETNDQDVTKDENVCLNDAEPQQTTLSHVPRNGGLSQERNGKNSYVILPPGSVFRPWCQPDSKVLLSVSDDCRNDTDPTQLPRSFNVLPQIKYVLNSDAVPPQDVRCRPDIQFPNQMGDSQRDRHSDDPPLLKRPRWYMHQVKDPKVYQIPRPFKVNDSASSALLDTDHTAGTGWTLSLDTKRDQPAAPAHTDHNCYDQFNQEIFFQRIDEDVNVLIERSLEQNQTLPQLFKTDYKKAETNVYDKIPIKTEDSCFDTKSIVTMEVNDTADFKHRDTVENLPVDTYTNGYELKQNSPHIDIDIKPTVTYQHYDLDNSAKIKLENPEMAIETDFIHGDVDRSVTVIDEVNQVNDGEDDVEYVMIPCDVKIAKLLGWPVHKLPRISKEHLDRYKDC